MAVFAIFDPLSDTLLSKPYSRNPENTKPCKPSFNGPFQDRMKQHLLAPNLHGSVINRRPGLQA